MIRLALLLAAVALAIPTKLLACTCAPPRTEREAIDRAETVFAGRVIQVRTILDDPGVPYLEATFLVRRWWKGEGGETVTVRTPHSTCGVPLRAGRAYRIFATPFRGHLATSTCSAPRPARSPVAIRATGPRGRECVG